MRKNCPSSRHGILLPIKRQKEPLKRIRKIKRRPSSKTETDWEWMLHFNDLMPGPVSFEFFWNSSSQLHNQLLKLYLWPKFINPSKIARTSSHRSREAKITNFFSSKKAKSVSYIIIFCIFSMTGCPHKAKVLYEAKKKSKTFKSRLVIFWFLG